MLLSFVKFATKVFFPPFLLSDALHAALRTNVVEGLGAVMGRMFTSGSNAQEAGFAKSWANGNIGNVPGPEPPLPTTCCRCDAALQPGLSLQPQNLVIAELTVCGLCGHLVLTSLTQQWFAVAAHQLLRCGTGRRSSLSK
jgi:hypothetical protein